MNLGNNMTVYFGMCDQEGRYYASRRFGGSSFYPQKPV
ncbi:hypothetical protein HMPREF1141_1224 [Clostridium sp. MSTE9]|nr:hypothetical protein HMPREF1141_1224 [Clostridium sp. MSTE9]